MFCDLVGSTALSACLDPEDLHEIIGAYQRLVADTIGHFDGFVAKYMGDGTLVYFGYPEAHEHDAERAVWAGLSPIEATGRLEIPVTLQVRIGLALAGPLSTRCGRPDWVPNVGSQPLGCAAEGAPYVLLRMLGRSPKLLQTAFLIDIQPTDLDIDKLLQSLQGPALAAAFLKEDCVGAQGLSEAVKAKLKEISGRAPASGPEQSAQAPKQ